MLAGPWEESDSVREGAGGGASALPGGGGGGPVGVGGVGDGPQHGGWAGQTSPASGQAQRPAQLRTQASPAPRQAPCGREVALSAFWVLADLSSLAGPRHCIVGHQHEAVDSDSP
jgi:hypothetical protein